MTFIMFSNYISIFSKDDHVFYSQDYKVNQTQVNVTAEDHGMDIFLYMVETGADIGLKTVPFDAEFLKFFTILF